MTVIVLSWSLDYRSSYTALLDPAKQPYLHRLRSFGKLPTHLLDPSLERHVYPFCQALYHLHVSY